jgi:hypothetical protein
MTTRHAYGVHRSSLRGFVFARNEATKQRHFPLQMPPEKGSKGFETASGRSESSTKGCRTLSEPSETFPQRCRALSECSETFLQRFLVFSGQADAARHLFLRCFSSALSLQILLLK